MLKNKLTFLSLPMTIFFVQERFDKIMVSEEWKMVRHGLFPYDSFLSKQRCTVRLLTLITIVYTLWWVFQNYSWVNINLRTQFSCNSWWQFCFSSMPRKFSLVLNCLNLFIMDCTVDSWPFSQNVTQPQKYEKHFLFENNKILFCFPFNDNLIKMRKYLALKALNKSLIAMYKRWIFYENLFLLILR